MAVLGTDIKILLSGDSGNTDPNLSLGGGRSADEVDYSPTLNNLFDNVLASESSVGGTEYRCVYVHNDHATDSVDDLKIWINSNTPSATTAIAIGLDPVGKNGTATGPISPSSSAPSGVIFSTPTTEGAGLNVDRLDAQDVYAMWIRRTVDASTAAAANDPFTLAFKGTPL